jgi:hypothetical protein
MKNFILILLSINTLGELDLSIPEQPAVFIEERKFLQFVEYEEPPTKAQYITFWSLNALDVYTTYQGVKHKNVYEVNPLFPKKPSLTELIVGKIILASLLGNNIDKTQMYFTNASLVYVVHNNYQYLD